MNTMLRIDSKETDLRIKEIAKNQNNFVPKKNEEDCNQRRFGSI